jgi:hypothetical protein
MRSKCRLEKAGHSQGMVNLLFGEPDRVSAGSPSAAYRLGALTQPRSPCSSASPAEIRLRRIRAVMAPLGSSTYAAVRGGIGRERACLRARHGRDFSAELRYC